MASLDGAGESVAVVNSIGRLLRGEAGNATPEDLASDRAAPVSGAIVPAYGAWPGRITPCHLSCIRLVLEGNNDVHYEPPFVPSPRRGARSRPRGRFAGRGEPHRPGIRRHPARLCADPAVSAGSYRQPAGLLRGARREEPVLGHRQRLSGGVPDQGNRYARERCDNSDQIPSRMRPSPGGGSG